MCTEILCSKLCLVGFPIDLVFAHSVLEWYLGQAAIGERSEQEEILHQCMGCECNKEVVK